jgi:hypothetical protein
MFGGVIAALLALATALLWNAFVFGFAAREVMVNPRAQTGANAELKRAADLALDFFVGVQSALACVVLKSGLLRGRLHWAARAALGIAAGVAASYVAVVGIVFLGVLRR